MTALWTGTGAAITGTSCIRGKPEAGNTNAAAGPRRCRKQGCGRDQSAAGATTDQGPFARFHLGNAICDFILVSPVMRARHRVDRHRVMKEKIIAVVVVNG